MKKQAQPAPSKVPANKTAIPEQEGTRLHILGGKDSFLEYGKKGWNNYLEHQPAFYALGTQFTVQLAEAELAALKKLKKAWLMADQSDLRIDVLEDHAALMAHFKSILWYIHEAFPRQAKKVKESGLLNFKLGPSYSRDKIVSMIHKVLPFLKKYQRELEANDNMPASFVKTFQDTANQYQKSLKKVVEAESSSLETKKMLNEAFDARYAIFKKMLRAADAVFSDNAGMRKVFSTAHLEKQVRATKKTNLACRLQEAGSKKNITNATVSILNHPLLAPIPGRPGLYKFELDAGTYSIKVKAPGYHVYSTTKVVKSGTQNRVLITLEPLAQAKANQQEQRPVAGKRLKAAANGAGAV